jgi:PAS domain S-box-containing protein
MNHLRSTFRAFVVALLATVSILVVRHFVFVPIFEFGPPAMPFLLAVTLAAWFGGLKAGLFTTVFTAGLLAMFFSSNSFSMSNQLRLSLFVVIGGLISWGVESLLAARLRMDDRQRELEREVGERRRAEAAEKSQREQLIVEMRRRQELELAVRDREERTRMAVQSANIGTFDLNPLTDERTWSDRTKIMFGLSADADVSNVSFLDRLHPDDKERAAQALQKAFDPCGDGIYDIDLRLLLPDHRVRWFIAKGQAFFDGEVPDRRAVRFIGTVLDITERKQAEESIRASESRLRGIMDNTSAVIYLKDLEGRYLLVNRRFEELLNVTQQQIVGKTGSDVFPTEVVAKLQANDRQVSETGQPLEFEETVPHTDGPHTYISVKFPIFDSAGQCSGIGGISTDITDRKKTADALEDERETLRNTIAVQDQDRQLIAYEIHDGLVQYATGGLMQLEAVRGHVQSPALAEQIERVVDILRKTVDEGRRIINGMHTTVLDDCGVVAAVDQLLEDEERAHVQVEFVKDPGLGRMAPTVELALYHITREALTNCYKHSQSEKVRIELRRCEDRVHLEIRDWGTGIVQPATVKGIHGLRGMTERARIAGGKCSVQNAPGKGTVVAVDVPYLSRN